MTIKYYRKNVYGCELLYVADANQRKIMEEITRRSTITPNMIIAFGILGIKFEEVLVPAKENLTKKYLD